MEAPARTASWPSTPCNASSMDASSRTAPEAIPECIDAGCTATPAGAAAPGRQRRPTAAAPNRLRQGTNGAGHPACTTQPALRHPPEPPACTARLSHPRLHRPYAAHSQHPLVRVPAGGVRALDGCPRAPRARPPCAARLVPPPTVSPCFGSEQAACSPSTYHCCPLLTAASPRPVPSTNSQAATHPGQPNPSTRCGHHHSASSRKIHQPAARRRRRPSLSPRSSATLTDRRTGPCNSGSRPGSKSAPARRRPTQQPPPPRPTVAIGRGRLCLASAPVATASALPPPKPGPSLPCGGDAPADVAGLGATRPHRRLLAPSCRRPPARPSPTPAPFEPVPEKKKKKKRRRRLSHPRPDKDAPDAWRATGSASVPRLPRERERKAPAWPD